MILTFAFPSLLNQTPEKASAVNTECGLEVRRFVEVVFEFTFQIVILGSEEVVSHFCFRYHPISEWIIEAAMSERSIDLSLLIGIENGKRVDEREILGDLFEFRMRDVTISIMIVGGEYCLDHGIDMTLNRLQINRLADSSGPVGKDGTAHLILLLVDI